MLRFPWLLSSGSVRLIALAAALAAPAVGWSQEVPAGGAPTTAPAGGAPPAAPAAPNPVTLPENEPLKDSVENFWHYAKIARYDVATAEGTRILGGTPDPVTLLAIFDAVAAGHHDNLDRSLFRWQGVNEMKDVTTQLIAVLDKAHDARRADPKYIEDNITLLATNERGYDLAIDRLRDSGELAVPQLVADLKDDSKLSQHSAIRRALADLGLSAVNPLLAATEMKDERTLMSIAGVLGDLGYDAAVPYLARLLTDTTTPDSVKKSANDALRRLRVMDPATLNAPEQFYMLGERFYYDNAAVRADKRLPIGRVWYWSDEKGLTFKDVPQPIFHDVMAKRSCEYALKLPGASTETTDAALSLWLSANFLDEAELPTGATDKTQAENSPTAHYWGALSGTKYLMDALNRANHDRNAPVALRDVQALQDIGGQSNLFVNGQPLLDALQFPDRLVRYETAFALAAALPQKPFAGEERVVPLLAEALSQTGAANVMVVMPTQDELNGAIDGLRTQGYNVVGGITVPDAVKNAAARPAIDAIVFPEKIGPTAVRELELAAAQTPRLQRAIRLVVTQTKATPYAVQATTDSTFSTTQANLTDYPALKVAIDDARKRGGLLPLDESTAGKYATRAAELLSKIAVNRSPVYDIKVAEPLLLSALEDPRPDIVKFDATVLGVLDGQFVQPSLLSKAADEKTPDELKVALFKGLAANVRNFGRHLPDDTQIEAIEKVVAGTGSVDVKTAAGEARGALNLSSQQAKKLIVDQARTSN